MLRSLICAVALLPAFAEGQGITRIDTVPAPSLAANVLGDPAWRQVSVYLPPSYSSAPRRRYPVVYWLHGFASTDRELISGIRQNLNIRLAMDSLVSAGAVGEMIIVMPNAKNAYNGSFYANSPVTGRWEDFIVQDLVRWVDRRYRTVRSRAGRGIAGFSMGGYGALRIAMRRSDRFSAVYAMSPCCLNANAFFDTMWVRRWHEVNAVKSIPDFRKASFHAQLLIAQTAVYSPDPRRPPLYLALPLVLDPKDGWLTMLPAMDLWDDDPLGRIPRSAPALKRLSIFVDAGLQDGFPDIPANVRRLDSTLTAMSIPHEAELYEGTHGNRVRERVVRRMLPFFSRAFARPR